MIGFFRDWLGRWAVDQAGVETGAYRCAEIREMVDRGEIGPHSWLRHCLTQKYVLAGEVLYYHKLAGQQEFEEWFPTPSPKPSSSSLGRA